MLKEVGGKTISCMSTGLMSSDRDCGLQADRFQLVFVGTITRIAGPTDDEMEVQITPDEVFHGNPGALVSAKTSQGLCFDELVVGKRWLFFLHTESGKPILLDYYSSQSIPVEHAEQTIETLRRLQTIGDYSILRGNVVRNGKSGIEELPNARIVAQRVSGRQEFSAISDAKGLYDFSQLPSGDYELRAESAGTVLGKERVSLAPGSCHEVSLTKYPKAQLEGHIRYPDGSPAKGMNVLLVNDEDKSWTSSETDAHGRFEFEFLRSGTYVIGFDLTGTAPWKNTSSSGGDQSAEFYYPGVMNRSQATPIALGEDEQRHDIEVLIPPKM